ncbi:MAG: hypothetical protein R3344_04300 [Acidobacteriota bacterium]|nr:hypothetical protein [Acidobacteriota bacterium]
MKRVALFVVVLVALSATSALAQIPLEPGVLYDREAAIDAYFATRWVGGPEVPSLPAPVDPEGVAPSASAKTFTQQTAEALTGGTSAGVEAAVTSLKSTVGSGALPLGSRGGAIMTSRREATRSIRKVIRDLG